MPIVSEQEEGTGVDLGEYPITCYITRHFPKILLKRWIFRAEDKIYNLDLSEVWQRTPC